MAVNSEDVIERLSLLGYEAGESDTLAIQLSISGAEQYIKNFCNIAEIPQELNNAAVEMAAGIFLKTKNAIGVNTAENIDFDGEGIKSITEGDVSITYSSDSSAAAKYSALLDKLCNRDDELVTFRRLRW